MISYSISLSIMLSRFVLLHIYMLLYMIFFHSFLRLSNIPLYKHTHTHTRHLYPFACWWNSLLTSISWLLEIVLQWRLECAYLFGLCFVFFGYVSRSGVARLSGTIFLVFWETSMLFPTVVAPPNCWNQCLEAVVLSHWSQGRAEARKQNIGTNDFLKHIIRL